jgi:hypothetical protein
VCAETSLAFLRPAPGDEVTVLVHACIEPTDGEAPNVDVWTELPFDAPEPSPNIVVVVEDPLAGMTEMSADEQATFDVGDEHCDAGFRIVVRRDQDEQAGVAAGWLRVAAVSDQPNTCTTSAETAP